MKSDTSMVEFYKNQKKLIFGHSEREKFFCSNNLEKNEAERQVTYPLI